MRGNHAMMNPAQIRLLFLAAYFRTPGPRAAVLAGSVWPFSELNCHTTKMKHLTLGDEEFPGRAIKDDPESWFLADEERAGGGRKVREGGRGGVVEREQEEDSAVLIHCGATTTTDDTEKQVELFWQMWKEN